MLRPRLAPGSGLPCLWPSASAMPFGSSWGWRSASLAMWTEWAPRVLEVRSGVMGAARLAGVAPLLRHLGRPGCWWARIGCSLRLPSSSQSPSSEPCHKSGFLRCFYAATVGKGPPRRYIIATLLELE